MNAPPIKRDAWRRLRAPAIATIVALTLLVGLGVWQLERRVWKEALIETLAQRLAVPTKALPAPEQWPKLDPADQEFRRVSFPAEFLYGDQAFVYTAGSAARGEPSGPGYWVFTPARLPGGSLIVVNRGFVAEARKADAQTGSPSLVDIVGIMRWPERRNIFTPSDNVPHNLWFARDHEAMAAAKGWGQVAPFFVDLELPMPPSGMPRPNPPTLNLRNDHLNYAITWFALAAALAAVFALWACKQLRENRTTAREAASL